MYTPDSNFVKRLKAVDNRLGCKYERTHGHFVINYERACGGAVPIFMVKSESGGYRQPDQRDMDFLLSGDLTKEDMKTKLQKSAKYMADVREKSKKDASDNIRGATKDGKIQLSNAFSRIAGGGKGNSAFRRVVPKQKGQVF